MKLPLCNKYGFDDEQRQKRLAFMGLSDEDQPGIDFLQTKIIQPFAEQIVAEFYRKLTTYPDIKNFINKHTRLENLKATQILYLKTYGVNFSSAEYFEERLKVGQVHAQINLPISYYEMAYRILNEIILEFILKHLNVSTQEYLDIVKLILNITALDMSLAIETYYNKKVNEMSSSINALMDERQVLSKQVERDELTRAASRARVMDFLQANVDKANEGGHHFCIAMIDLDHFKCVNDEYGHLVGDEILKGVSARMMAALRQDDMLGRYGGEEFVLVFPGANIKIAERISKRICKHIEEEPFQVEQHSIPVTVSMGVAQWHKGEEVEKLLGYADHALYKAKHQGRNQVVVEYYQDTKSA